MPPPAGFVLVAIAATYPAGTPPPRPSSLGPVAQAIQIVGALIILGAFAASQLGELATDSRLYLALNVVGSVILAVLAVIEGQIGFILLEGVWALVSAWSLFVLLGEEADAAEAAEELGPPDDPAPPAP
jgi:hypothetical protein